MSRTIRAVIGVIFVLVIVFSGTSICQRLGSSMKADLTEQKLYTLSDGTKAILAKLHHPIKLKLYYAKTASLKVPDEIRYFENYYQFVKSLLEEYAAAARGMIELEIIDPRPFSDEEEWAFKFGLSRFVITPEENFFFGLVAQSQFGAEKVIPFFLLDRQSFVEYDISHLIDTVITRQKKTIGIISSLPVMGDEANDDAARLKRIQNQPLNRTWAIIEHLRQQYKVKTLAYDVEEIKDVDVLLIIHPKNLREQTLYAIDQFVLKGGKTIVCMDPFCLVDQPDRQQDKRQTSYSRSSDLNVLVQNWGVEMPRNTFAGDRNLADKATLLKDERPETLIGFLNLKPGCFNTESTITAELNQVRLFFPGVLRKVAGVDERETGRSIKLQPLIMTTDKGNSWLVTSQDELVMHSPSELMHNFTDGDKPVVMGYLITGRFKSSFPEGIYKPAGTRQAGSSTAEEDKSPQPTLTEAKEDCAVVVFADVDFISDILAYQVVGDNRALLLNAIEDLCGSSELAAIRSRGNFARPFTIVDEIEKQAEAETAEEEVKITTEITRFRNELYSVKKTEEGEPEIIGTDILQKKKELELKIHQARRKLRQVKMEKREKIENLGNKLRNLNMMTAPTAILIIAIILSIHRTIRRRHYISHASDA